MFERLRKIKQQRIVKQLSSVKRTKVMHNFDTANVIGIIFNVSTENDWMNICSIVKKFEGYGKKVYLVGVIDNREKLDFIITNTNVTLVHAKTDINYWGIPKISILHQFLDRKYDVLINAMVDSDDFFSLFVNMHTLADLKIACDNLDNEKYYDLLIKVDSDISESDFLKQVIYYLTLINK